MRKVKQPNQRLLSYLQADRQWRREKRIAHARAKLAETIKLLSLPGEVDFWLSVLEANGATQRHIDPSTRWAMGDKNARTGKGEAISYQEYLRTEVHGVRA
jgi:hypothetical protein